MSQSQSKNEPKGAALAKIAVSVAVHDLVIAVSRPAIVGFRRGLACRPAGYRLVA